MKAQSRITQHGKLRVKERTNTYKRGSTLSRLAYQNGKTKNYYQGKFRQYLISKSARKAKIKVYKDNIYIFSKNTKRLITTYSIPQKYLPVEQYEITKELIDLSNKIKMLTSSSVIVTYKNGDEIRGYIDDDYNPQFMNKFILITEEKDILVDLNEIEDINIDEEWLSKELKDSVNV